LCLCGRQGPGEAREDQRQQPAAGSFQHMRHPQGLVDEHQLIAHEQHLGE
jgi:hypothetical protein